jgi:hypothetical protein
MWNYRKEGNSKFLQNVSNHKSNYTVSYFRLLNSFISTNLTILNITFQVRYLCTILNDERKRILFWHVRPNWLWALKCPSNGFKLLSWHLLVWFLCFVLISETFSSVLLILRWQIFNFTRISAIQKLSALRVCITIWSNSTMSSIRNLSRKPYVYWLALCNIKIHTNTHTYIHAHIYI